MKKRVMERWVKALRSGKYKQGKNYLCIPSDNQYCCLGVLCELSKLDEFDDSSYGDATYKGQNQVLPYDVKEWAGLHSTDGKLTDSETLASLNDDGKTFKQIATIIEKNYKKL